MNQVIGRAIEENSEKLSQDVSYLVHDKLMKELEYLMRVSDEREESASSASTRSSARISGKTRGERKQQRLRQGGFHFSGPV